MKETKTILEDKIKKTTRNEEENPDFYTTNALTVKRAADLAYLILKFMQLLCENHN